MISLELVRIMFFLPTVMLLHDCQAGDHLIMSSHSALGGHVEVDDFVNIGGMLEYINFVVWVNTAWYLHVLSLYKMFHLTCWLMVSCGGSFNQ